MHVLTTDLLGSCRFFFFFGSGMPERNCYICSSPFPLMHFSHCNQEIIQREQEGQLDEGFLAEVSAQLRQVRPLLLILI